jgi:hypothetical protein
VFVVDTCNKVSIEGDIPCSEKWPVLFGVRDNGGCDVKSHGCNFMACAWTTVIISVCRPWAHCSLMNVLSNFLGCPQFTEEEVKAQVLAGGGTQRMMG